MDLHPLLRPLVGFVAGAIVVFLIDRFVWPGTLVPGIIGVAAATAVLAFTKRQ